ncbi:MAG: hypothetical protein AAGG02_09120 [Cyanobacteria bacterium P01_H01_bin.15]
MEIPATVLTKIAAIKAKREYLVTLSEDSSIGILRLDINQALDELDELISELDEAFSTTGEV